MINDNNGNDGRKMVAGLDLRPLWPTLTALTFLALVQDLMDSLAASWSGHKDPVRVTLNVTECNIYVI